MFLWEFIHQNIEDQFKVSHTATNLFFKLVNLAVKNDVEITLYCKRVKIKSLMSSSFLKARAYARGGFGDQPPLELDNLRKLYYLRKGD